MINGRYDSFFPVETLQEPMYRLLGAPATDKRHVVFDSGHTPPTNFSSRRLWIGWIGILRQ